MKKGALGIVRDQLTPVPPVCSRDLDGKTVVVVGANTGLGFEAAKHLARMKPGKFIMACRNEEKGKEALKQLKEETKCETAELWTLDLCKFSSVVSFADRFATEGGGRLDILLANAAMTTFECRMTDDGWEETMQVNVLSTSLLCLLLLPHALETAKKFSIQPRIVIVNSEMHYLATFSDEIYAAPSALRVLNDKAYLTPKRMGGRYSETKLLNVFFTRALAEALRDTPVIVTTVNPGLCRSNLRREFTGFIKIMVCVFEILLARTTEEGGRLLVHGCVGRADDPDSLRGAYINLQDVDEPSDHAVGDMGKKHQDRFWKELIEELSSIDSRVKELNLQT